MKLFKSNKIKFVITVAIFATLFAIIYKNWYFSFKPITNGDLGFLYKDSLIELFNTLAPAWNSGINFGANTASVLNYFGYNFWSSVFAKFGFEWNLIIRFIFFYPLLIGLTISTLLVSKIFKNKISVALIFGFVFSINTFIFAWINLMVAYAILPIVIFSLYEYLKGRKIIWLLFFCLVFSYTIFYEIRAGFIAFLLSIILVFFHWIYTPTSKKIYARQGIQMLLALVGVFLLNAFFIFPLFQGSNYSSISGITSQGLFGTQFYNLQYALTLMQPYWNGVTLVVFSQQPLKFYFWLYPLFAFSALFFAKKDKRIIYFSLLAIFGIFMGKGANIPLGGIYAWAYHHLPFFNFFREPIQWWIIIGFSYAVLIAYFFYYLYQEIETIVQKKLHKGIFVSNFIKIILTLPIVLVVLSIAVPAYSGKLNHGLNPVSFAQEYDEFRQFLLKEKSFYRLLSIPSNQRFTYYSSNHPYVAFNYIPDTLKSLDTKLLSLESIRYIVLPDDVLDDVYVNPYNKKQYENLINSTISSQAYNPLKQVKSFGNIEMWKNPNDIPHLMAVKDLVYVIGSQNISQVVSIPTSKQVAYYAQQTIPPDVSKKIADSVTNANSSIYKNATKIYSVADCVRCDVSKNYLDFVQFPFARFLPGTIFYPFIEIKENKTLLSIVSPEDRFKMDAFFAEKRATEIQQMEESPFVDSRAVISTLGRANALITDMENRFNEMNTSSVDNGFLQTWDYLFTERRTYDDLYQNESDKKVGDLFSNMTSRLNDLIKKLSQKIWVTQGDEKKLIATLPIDGNYKILLKSDNEADFSNAQLTMNDRDFQKASVSDNGFLNFGSQQLNKGSYFLSLYVPSLNLLKLSSLPTVIDESSPITIVSLKDSLSQYKLTFDYKITGARSGKIFISDDAYPRNFDSFNGNIILTSVLQAHNDDQWHHFSVYFSPYGNITDPVLHLKSSNEGSGTIFTNISLTKVITPVIVFVYDTGKVLATPKLTYQEITPTDYILKVEDEKKPFLLSFSEQYDNSWVALSTDKRGFYGNKAVVANYFNGNVRELANVNKIEPAVLAGSIMGDGEMNALHIGLNSFSNGWLINKTGTYQIYLTFSPQKAFLIGLFISAATFLLILLAIGVLLVKMKKKY